MNLFVSSEVAKAAVENVLAKQRAKPNFGNVGAVNNLLDHAKEQLVRRQDKSKLEGRYVIKVEDLFLKPADDAALQGLELLRWPIDVSSSPLVQELLDMIGLEDVKQSVLALLKISNDNYQSELCGEGTLDISLHRMFIGNPGTGKTTVAKLYGRILASIGYLSNGEVVVVGASRLIGSAVGETSTIVNNLIDSAKGKVNL
jgi:SpoVK/Ycf46/Vps4 family AAA+-type ATPase